MSFAIKAENISKIYRLYDKPIDRVKESLSFSGKKYHRDFYALHNVSFEIRKGEILGVIGKNGSGKSTLLKIMTGVLTPAQGSIQVNGRVSALLELGTGFNPNYTGLENIYLNGAISGFSKKEIDLKLEDILSFADIGAYINQPVRTYSSGMFIRLAFAVAIHVDPDILIIDEALSVGDELFQRKCFSKIREFMKKDKTIVLVSHNGATIVEFCTRALLFNSGEMILDANPKLAVSLYSKLVYAKPEVAAQIKQEIKDINSNDLFKESYGKSEELVSLQPKEDKSSDLMENFSEDLKSQSIVEYKSYDVEILEVAIYTLDQKKVNMLVFNRTYLYTYKVRFHMSLDNVIFGMMIKNLKGTEISGYNTQSQTSNININPGDEYLVSWLFECKLVPGTYYTNVGVESYINNQKVFLNRMMDAYVFKVQELKGNNFSGLVYLDQKATITKLN